MLGSLFRPRLKNEQQRYACHIKVCVSCAQLFEMPAAVHFSKGDLAAAVSADITQLPLVKAGRQLRQVCLFRPPFVIIQAVRRHMHFATL